MNTNEAGVDRVLAIFGDEMHRARKHWWLFLLLGIVLVIGGIVAIAYPCVSSVAAIMVLGIILIVSGVFTIIGAFWAGKWSALLLQLLVGILYIMAGIAIRDAPVESTGIMTLFIAAFFIVVGAFRIIVSLVERFPQWGWALVNGIVTLLAGIIIYDTFPNSALWVIGLLLGLELLLNGWTWIMLSVVIHNLPDRREESADDQGASTGQPA
jgi:uncharacterized membrane protein HdeD (DUF308 family)